MYAKKYRLYVYWSQSVHSDWVILMIQDACTLLFWLQSTGCYSSELTALLLNESVSCWKKYKRPTCRHLVEALDTAFQLSPCMTLVCPHEASWVWSNICMIPEINTARLWTVHTLLILKMAHVVQSGFGRLSWFAKSVCRPGVTNLGLGAITGFFVFTQKD